MKCPCHSGKEYEMCCEPFHKGKWPENALLLMRSRYSAYALGKSDYIIDTTHPDHPDSKLTHTQKIQKIKRFSESTRFENLAILDFKEDKEEAFVTFHATLKQKARDSSFTEKSRFLKKEGKWLYVSGEILPTTP